MSEGVFNALSEPEESEGGVSEVKNNGHETPKEEAWIVSTKTRRLAPAFTLSRKDLGADSSRNAAASAAASAAHDAAALKKKVIRYSREDMLHLWKPSKILNSMKDMTDMVSVASLHPMSLQPLEQEDVMRLWYADRDKLKDVAKGRGKGRGKGIDGEDEEGGDDEWSRGRPNADRKDGPWDDIEDVEGTPRIGGRGGSGGLDLADFAAATLKFRSDTRGLGMMDLGDDGRPKAALEDEMEMLFREQKDNILPDNLGDDTEEPEWADAYINNSMHQTAYQPAHDSSSSKRSLLFETLKMRDAEVPAPAVQAQTHSQSIYTDKAVYSMPALLPLPVLTLADSWFYRDPQNMVQGPYETASMRQWHEARYFTQDLPIKLTQWHDFHPLGLVFMNNAQGAFSPHMAMPPEPSTIIHSRLGPPPMRPLQSEIMDIDIILRQQQEQRLHIEREQRLHLEQEQRQQLERERRQQLQQQQLQQQIEEQRRLQLLEEQQEAIKAAHLQQMLQQQFEAQEKERIEKIRQAQYEYDREQQQLHQMKQQQLMYEKAKQEELHLEQQQQQLLIQQQQQQLQMQQLQQQQLQQQQQQQQQQLLLAQQQKAQRLQEQQAQQQIQETLEHQQRMLQQQQQQQAQRTQKVAVPVPTGPVWGGSTVRSPSLAEIQEEEYRLRSQQPQAPSRGSSFQLKSLLGLSSSSSFSPNAPVESSAWEAPAAARPAVTPSPSLKEILRQEEAKHVEETELKQQQSQLLMQQQIRAARESAAAESATALVIANSSWSGSAVGDAAARKSKTAKAAPSLRDIMQLEEASSAALQSQVASPDSPFASAPRPAPGSWAAKASSLSGGPTPMSAARPTPHTASNSNVIAVNGSKKSAASIVSPPAVVSMPSKPQPAGPSFGGGRSGFSADLSEWCVAQLAKIRAADSDSNADPTEFFGVLEYCATLQSAVEVRETFSAYLGSTILVSNFATEFLKRKDGQPSAPSAAAVTGGANGSSGSVVKKKGKKGNTEF